jgi:outer membrane protein assembly factor BamD
MLAWKNIIGTIVILSLLLGACGWKKRGLVEKETAAAALYKKGLALYKKRDYDRALELFNELKGGFPGEDPYYTWAELKIADCYFFKKEYTEAISHYEEFKKFHPFHGEIQYVVFQIALSYFKQMKSVDRDQEATRKALSNFEFLIANYPPSVFTEKAREKVKICRERMAGKELYVAKFYYKKKKYQGAKARLEAMVKLYPEVDAFGEALFYLGKSHLKLGEMDLARKVFTDLVGSYPYSKFSDEAKEELKELPEEEFPSTGTETTK